VLLPAEGDELPQEPQHLLQARAALAVAGLDGLLQQAGRAQQALEDQVVPVLHVVVEGVVRGAQLVGDVLQRGPEPLGTEDLGRGAEDRLLAFCLELAHLRRVKPGGAPDATYVA
jgi:hypothetical protein